MKGRLIDIGNKYKIILILMLMIGVLVVFKLNTQEKTSDEKVTPPKINGLSAEEIEGMNIDEYNEFVSNLSDTELDKVPTRYDISEYVLLETDDFLIKSFNEENKTLTIELKNKDIDKAKQIFEKWYLGNVNNNRSEINVVWEN